MMKNRDARIFSILCFTIFLFFVSKNLFASIPNLEKKEKNSQTQNLILRIVTDPIFEDLINKFTIIFEGAANVLKFRDDSKSELTLIFEEVCMNSNPFREKNMQNYEPQIIVANRELNQYEKTICEGKLRRVKIGHYAFVILNKIANIENENNLDLEDQKNQLRMDISSEDLRIALQAMIPSNETMLEEQNTKTKWNQINQFFPDENIKIYGPKINSPFFLYLQENFFVPGCAKNDFYFFKYKDNFDQMISNCKNYRIDSIYIEDDENSRLSSEKIFENKSNFGILPYHFYKRLVQKNGDIFVIHNFDGVQGTVENIKNQKYALSWPIYIYMLDENLKTNNLLKKFISEITSKEISGKNGILTEYGLISLE